MVNKFLNSITILQVNGKDERDNQKTSICQECYWGLVLGLGFAIYQNFSLNKQSNSLVNQYVNLGEQYLDLSGRYVNLKTKKFTDSSKVDMQNSINLLNLQRNHMNELYEKDSLEIKLYEENIKLIRENDSLYDKNLDLTRKFLFITSEREFYKQISYYLDSLLAKYRIINGESDPSLLK